MRPILSAAAAAALLSLAGAASAQDAAPGAEPMRQLSWPGKRAAPPPAERGPVAAPPSAVSYDPTAVPAPFTAATVGPRINNRYSARGAAPRRLTFAAAAAPSPVLPTPAPVYAPAPSFPTADYGPPVIPNEVKPARIFAAPEPVQPQPAPARPAPTRLAPVIAERPAEAAPVPVRRPEPPVAQAAQAPAPTSPVAAAPTPAPVQAAAPSGERPFVRPASPNGPRFYSVHREFGGRPDATLRTRPAGPATERLPSGFFASGEAAEAEDEPQDDAETRAAALRAAEKAQKAKGGKR